MAVRVVFRYPDKIDITSVGVKSLRERSPPPINFTQSILRLVVDIACCSYEPRIITPKVYCLRTPSRIFYASGVH
jgi:hypothetical protein